MDENIEVEAPEADVDPFDLSDDELQAYEDPMVPESVEDSPEEVTEEAIELGLEPEETVEEVDQGEVKDEADPVTEDLEEEETEPEEVIEVDFEAEYKKLMSPFNANGKELKIDSVEESIKLMQMGANYTKKMVELKPHLKLIKMLQKNELVDEGKLNYLIDLSNKNPEAIAKLIKDSGIDPLDLDQESKEYTPKNYAVSDKEVNLDEVLGQIESTPTYNQTLDIVGKQWDDSSKEVLSAQPRMIAQINDHVANGIYDKIVAEIDKQQMFGGLQGLSNLEAYQKIGKDLYDAGKFNTEPTPISRAKPKTKQSEAVRKLKKRAASPTKAAPRKEVVKKEVNYFDLSDEELAKLPTNY